MNDVTRRATKASQLRPNLAQRLECVRLALWSSDKSDSAYARWFYSTGRAGAFALLVLRRKAGPSFRALQTLRAIAAKAHERSYTNS